MVTIRANGMLPASTNRRPERVVLDGIPAAAGDHSFGGEIAQPIREPAGDGASGGVEFDRVRHAAADGA